MVYRALCSMIQTHNHVITLCPLCAFEKAWKQQAFLARVITCVPFTLGSWHPYFKGGLWNNGMPLKGASYPMGGRAGKSHLHCDSQAAAGCEAGLPFIVLVRSLSSPPSLLSTCMAVGGIQLMVLSSKCLTLPDGSPQSLEW